MTSLNTRVNQISKRLLELTESGYKDVGWANGGATWSSPSPDVYEPGQYEKLNMSMYRNRGTHVVYIRHDIKEIMHVDMSD